MRPDPRRRPAPPKEADHETPQRDLATLIALLLTGVVGATSVAAEHAPISGTVVHKTSYFQYIIEDDTIDSIEAAYGPLAGATVTAYAPSTNGAPGPKIIATAITGDDGTFSLDVGPGPVCVQVSPPAEWQSGWVYEPREPSSQYVRNGVGSSPPETCTLMAGDWLGEIGLQDAVATGWVVNQGPHSHPRCRGPLLAVRLLRPYVIRHHRCDR